MLLKMNVFVWICIFAVANALPQRKVNKDSDVKIEKQLVVELPQHLANLNTFKTEQPQPVQNNTDSTNNSNSSTEEILKKISQVNEEHALKPIILAPLNNDDTSNILNLLQGQNSDTEIGMHESKEPVENLKDETYDILIFNDKDSLSNNKSRQLFRTSTDFSNFMSEQQLLDLLKSHDLNRDQYYNPYRSNQLHDNYQNKQIFNDDETDSRENENGEEENIDNRDLLQNGRLFYRQLVFVPYFASTPFERTGKSIQTENFPQNGQIQYVDENFKRINPTVLALGSPDLDKDDDDDEARRFFTRKQNKTEQVPVANHPPVQYGNQNDNDNYQDDVSGENDQDGKIPKLPDKPAKLLLGAAASLLPGYNKKPLMTSDNIGDGIFIDKIKVRKGGVAIAGPGGIATAGGGGTAIVGPHGFALTQRNGVAIAGPGARVISIPDNLDLTEFIVNVNKEKPSEARYLSAGGKLVATGPVVYFDSRPN